MIFLYTDNTIINNPMDVYEIQGKRVFIPSNTANNQRINAFLNALNSTSSDGTLNGSLSLGRVDCTILGSQPIGIVGRNGYGFRPLAYSLFVIQANTVTSTPKLSIGTNSPNFDNISKLNPGGTGVLDLTGYVVGDGNTFVFNQTKWKAILNPTIIYANVTVVSIANTYVIGGDFEGKLIPI